ncbi:hypothetical protein HMPREF9451_00516 [Slackia piriformis YIT 12062]|uniref:Polysaccharide chain length determinant N-terminal domain-containing protein n=2 Tax=Eggerthellaceae TaxID=1643826 RepID=K0YKR4_9ACTN|nr:hypothetical protein HMPREF9451_00516 [Slackia piriformis YIT 12062]
MPHAWHASVLFSRMGTIRRVLFEACTQMDERFFERMTLLELLQLLRKRLALVIALPIVCALAMGAYSYFFMSNTYTASTSLYVLTKTETSNGSSNMYSDLNASQLLTNDVATLIKSDRVMGDTAKALSMQSLAGFDVAITSETTTRVITLSVTGEDADATAVVANKLAESASSVAQEVMDIQSVNVIDKAVAPVNPSGPNRPMYVAVALMAGLFLAVAIVVVADMLNTKVRRVEEVEELLGLPVIGRMPAMKGGR